MILGPSRTERADGPVTLVTRFRNVRTRVWQKVVDWLGGWRPSRGVV